MFFAVITHFFLSNVTYYIHCHCYQEGVFYSRILKKCRAIILQDICQCCIQRQAIGLVNAVRRGIMILQRSFELWTSECRFLLVFFCLRSYGLSIISHTNWYPTVCDADSDKQGRQVQLEMRLLCGVRWTLPRDVPSVDILARCSRKIPNQF